MSVSSKYTKWVVNMEKNYVENVALTNKYGSDSYIWCSTFNLVNFLHVWKMDVVIMVSMKTKLINNIYTTNN